MRTVNVRTSILLSQLSAWADFSRERHKKVYQTRSRTTTKNERLAWITLDVYPFIHLKRDDLVSECLGLGPARTHAPTVRLSAGVNRR